MKSKSRLLPVFAAVALLAGCSSPPDPPQVLFIPTTAGLVDMTDRLVVELLAKEGVLSAFRRASARLGGAKPVIQIAKLDNLVNGPDGRLFTQALEVCRKTAERNLQDSGLFRTVNAANAPDSDAESLNESIKRDLEVGLVDDRIAQNAGRYLAADFVLEGEFRRVGPEETYTLVLFVKDHFTRERWTATGFF